MKALVVVADPSARKKLEDFFARRKHTIEVCSNSRDAQRALEDHTFQFVLLDLTIDVGMIELCRAIRSGAEGDRTFVIVFPRSETPSNLRGALEVGADDYLIKPLDITRLQLKLAIGERILAARIASQGRLAKQDQLYRTLVETMREGLFQVDSGGRIEFANSRLSKITGYGLDELVGQSADDLLVESEFRQRLPGQTLLGSKTGSEEYSIPLRHKDGTPIWVKLTAAPFAGSAQGRGSLGVVQDITEQRNAEEGLRHREEYFRALLENATDLISIVDLENQILYQSLSSQRTLDIAADDLVGRKFIDHVHEDDQQRFTDAFSAALDVTDGTAAVEVRFRHRSGEWRHLESMCKNLIDNPILGGVVITSRDVTDRRRIEAALKRERAFFQQLFRNSPAGIVILDNTDHVADANHSFVDLFQFEVAEIAGHPLSDFIVPDRLRGEASELSDLVFANQNVERETVRLRKDGAEVDVSILGYPIELADRQIGAYGIYSDITERKQAERKLFHEAFHDSLTGLPNRTLLADRLERDLRRARRRLDYQFALLFIDLDGFKSINDSLGHATGDAFLIEVAERLKKCLRPGDTTARLGGDEFTIVLEDIKEFSDATRIAERILLSLDEPFALGDQKVRASGSIGIAFSSTGYEDAEALLRDADIAMYRAKSRGKACYEIFDEDMQKNALERLDLESAMRNALDNEEFFLLYQPVVSLVTREIVSFEVLARWQHPKKGLLGPEKWLPICVETGLIVTFGQWVLKTACTQLAAWQEDNPESSSAAISINLDQKEIQQHELWSVLEAAVKEAGVHPANLSLEIKETALDSSDEGARNTFWRLGTQGCRLIVDGFGSGRSSLADLHRLPIDAIKIDRQLLERMEQGGEEVEILRAAGAIGDSLGLKTIAVGVERLDQLELARELGIKYAQGNLLSPPVDGARAGEMINSKQDLMS